MIINDSFPKFDLPIDFIADDSITGDILNYYSNFPCKIKAGVFVLCTEGMVKATINLLEVVIRKNDFVIVLPNSFIQIHEVSSDTRISFAGFSSDFMLSGNYVEILLDSMPMILNSPVISLQDDIAGLYRNVYLLLIRAYTLPPFIRRYRRIRYPRNGQILPQRSYQEELSSPRCSCIRSLRQGYLRYTEVPRR